MPFRSPRAVPLLMLVPALAVGCRYAGPTGASRAEVLWEATVARHLQDPLWLPRDLEDANEYLMVPLHAAFRKSERLAWRQALSAHFQRFVAAYQRGEMGPEPLDRLNYFYLASWFVALCARTGETSLVPGGLWDILEGEARKYWDQVPAWQWDRAAFPGGVKERLEWKLTVPTVAFSYYRAIIDEEHFLLGTAVNLVSACRRTGRPVPSFLEDMRSMGARIYRERMAPAGEATWAFQPGVWTDHPDYAYAGVASKVPEPVPAPVPGIAEDSSHSHRQGLWILGHEEAASDPAERAMFQDLRRRLGRQLMSRVVALPAPDFPAVRLTNYMDGRNGLYRWRYATQGSGGYGPFELSGTFCEGWWSFTQDPEVRSAYGFLAWSFPLPPAVVSVYVGPNTTRPRHPLVTLPEAYANGYFELLAHLASE